MESNQVCTKTLSNGITMPMIGLGLGAWQQQDDTKTIEESVEIGLQAGYRHFDTTPHNDEVIGKVLDKWISSGKIKREELFIVSKLPLTAMWSYRVNEFLRQALKSLKMEYVDMYLIQFPVGLQPSAESLAVESRDEEGKVQLDRTYLEPIWKAMETEVRLGRTRSIGVCDFNTRQLNRILRSCTIPPALLQTELNVYFQQKDIQLFCSRRGIAVCAYAPLGLLDMTEIDISPDEGLKHKVTKDPLVHQLARKYGRTPSQILLRFLLQSDIIVIPKALNPYDIKTSIKSCAFTLDSADMNQLAELDNPDKEHMSKAILSEIFTGVENHPEFPWST